MVKQLLYALETIGDEIPIKISFDRNKHTLNFDYQDTKYGLKSQICLLTRPLLNDV